MLIHPSSGACDYLVRYCVGCIVENASDKISYRRFTIVSFLLISSMPVTELQLQFGDWHGNIKIMHGPIHISATGYLHLLREA